MSVGQVSKALASASNGHNISVRSLLFIDLPLPCAGVLCECAHQWDYFSSLFLLIAVAYAEPDHRTLESTRSRPLPFAISSAATQWRLAHLKREIRCGPPRGLNLANFILEPRSA